MQLCWEICIRWHKKLRMLTTKSGLPTLNNFSLTLWSMNNKKGTWNMVSLIPHFGYQLQKTLNEKTGKGFSPKQMKDKHNRLRQKQRKWGQLLRHTRLGWDATTQTITASDEVWANVIAVCYIYYPNSLYIWL